MQFRVDEPMPSEDIRAIVGTKMFDEAGDELPYTVNEVSIEGIADGTVYKVDSSLEDVSDLKSAVEGAFAESDSGELVTYKVLITPTGDQTNIGRPRADRNGTMLTATTAQEGGEDDEATEEAEPPADSVDASGVEESAAESTGVIDPNARVGDERVVSSSFIELGVEDGSATAEINAVTLKEELVNAAKSVGVELTERLIILRPIGEGTEEWKPDSQLAFNKWRVEIPLAAAEADQVMEAVKQSMDSDPVWISSSSIGRRVAGDMIGRALAALFASLLCIIGYIWFRFQRVLYGFAAVAALVHDVLITLGAIAVSYWLADALGFLLIDPFKISLTVVAALLTIIGYSLNDTIVVFDRIRETKGKAPRLTGEMINSSINQTLSRTLLTSLTTLIVVVLLYAFGGQGIHAFAFALVIGVLVGTYSSVFIASPILLWLLQRSEKTKAA